MAARHEPRRLITTWVGGISSLSGRRHWELSGGRPWRSMCVRIASSTRSRVHSVGGGARPAASRAARQDPKRRRARAALGWSGVACRQSEDSGGRWWRAAHSRSASITRCRRPRPGSRPARCQRPSGPGRRGGRMPSWLASPWSCGTSKRILLNVPARISRPEPLAVHPVGPADQPRLGAGGPRGRGRAAGRFPAWAAGWSRSVVVRLRPNGSSGAPGVECSARGAIRRARCDSDPCAGAAHLMGLRRQHRGGLRGDPRVEQFGAALG